MSPVRNSPPQRPFGRASAGAISNGMSAIKLISLNIEKDRHLDLVERFLREQAADFVCLQEVYESSMPRIAEAFGGSFSRYIPMTKRSRETPPQVQGIGIFSRFPTEIDVRYYNRYGDSVPESVDGEPATYNITNRPLVICDVQKNGEHFGVGTTHFTWTPDSKASDEQRGDMHTMLDELEKLDDFALCGDFNAPRGGETFSMLAAKYKDAIPASYASSLDPNLHRAGHLQIMVDGLFTTPGYSASDVRLQFGLSDHAAIVATISKA